MVKCPWCGQEVPVEEYSRHYDICYKGKPPEKEFKTQEKIWKVKAREFFLGREHWEKVMIEPIGGKLLEYKRGEYVIFEAPRRLIEDYIRRRILYDYEILEDHSKEVFLPKTRELE